MGALVTTSKLAAAERPMVSLRYAVGEGAGSCPNETELRGRVLEEVGYDPFVSDPRARSFSIEISRERLFTARVVDRSTSGADSVRTMTSSVSCDDLVESVVLALAVTLDPEIKAAEPRPPAVAGKPEVTVVPVLVPVYVDRPVAPPPQPTQHDPIEGFVAAGFGVGGGFVPGVSTGPTLAIGVRQKQWELSAEGTMQLPGSSENIVGTAVVHAILGSLVPCFTPSFASWGRALVCGNVSLGAASVSAEGVVNEYPSLELAAFTGPRAGASMHVAPHFDIRIAGDLLVNLAPLEASIDHYVGSSKFSVVTYGAPPVAGRVVTALSVSFP